MTCFIKLETSVINIDYLAKNNRYKISTILLYREYSINNNSEQNKRPLYLMKNRLIISSKYYSIKKNRNNIISEYI